MPTRIQVPELSRQATGLAPLETRRAFLGKSGVLLSGAAIALLAGRDALAKESETSASDIRVLNSALGAELEAIATYQLGAESGLLQKPVFDLAATFQGHHRRTGPKHCGLLGRRAASVAGFEYSDAMKRRTGCGTERLSTDSSPIL